MKCKILYSTCARFFCTLRICFHHFFLREFKVGDEDNNSTEVSSDFVSVENIYQQNERAATRGEQKRTGQTVSRDGEPTALKPFS